MDENSRQFVVPPSPWGVQAEEPCSGGWGGIRVGNQAPEPWNPVVTECGARREVVLEEPSDFQRGL